MATQGAAAKPKKGDAAADNSQAITEAGLTGEQEAYLEQLAAKLEGKGLWAKIAWVQAHVGQVEKTGQMAHGNVRYAFMQEHGLINVIRPLCRIAGLAIVPGLMEPNHFSNEGNQYVVLLALTVVDPESGDSVTRFYPNMGVDNSDKGFGKAYTGATKYALQKFFLVPTDAIDDNDALTVDKVGGNVAGAEVRDIASAKPSKADVDGLRTILVEQGKAGNPGLAGAKVKNKLTADFGRSKIDDLTKSEFATFTAWVQEQIVEGA